MSFVSLPKLNLSSSIHKYLRLRERYSLPVEESGKESEFHFSSLLLEDFGCFFFTTSLGRAHYFLSPLHIVLLCLILWKLSCNGFSFCWLWYCCFLDCHHPMVLHFLNFCSINLSINRKINQKRYERSAREIMKVDVEHAKVHALEGNVNRLKT